MLQVNMLMLVEHVFCGCINCFYQGFDVLAQLPDACALH